MPRSGAKTLAQPGRIRKWIIPLWLCTALALQVAALMTPFLEISMFLKGTEVYGLWQSVHMLWDEGLYAIVTIVVGFSIIFPFVKLAGLTSAWFLLREPAPRSRLLGALGTLGKWSMIDPFCVILLVAASSEQWAVAASARIGIYCFFLAIVLSMTLSIVMTSIHRTDCPAVPPRATAPFRMATRAGLARSALVGTMLLLSLAALALAIDLPFLQIDQFLLRSDAFGITDLGIELAHEAQWPLAALVGIGLIAAPAATIVLEAWYWLAKATPEQHLARRHRVAFVAEWSMLEVFSLAVVLFLLEGERFIKTEARGGLWAIVIAALLSIATRRIVHSLALACLTRPRTSHPKT